MTQNTHDKPSLGRIWHRQNPNNSKIFLSGIITINKDILDRFMTADGITIEIVGNKALKPDKNGDGYYVLFENNYKGTNKPVPQAKGVPKVIENIIIDDEQPF